VLVTLLAASLLLGGVVRVPAAGRARCGDEAGHCRQPVIAPCCCKAPVDVPGSTATPGTDLRPVSSTVWLGASPAEVPTSHSGPRSGRPVPFPRASTPLVILFSTFLI
jgi:hypothetical protein